MSRVPRTKAGANLLLSMQQSAMLPHARQSINPVADCFPVEEPSPTLEGVSWTVFPEPAAEPDLQNAKVNALLTDKLRDAKVRLHRRGLRAAATALRGESLNHHPLAWLLARLLSGP
jgi:hypothetical protein